MNAIKSSAAAFLVAAAFAATACSPTAGEYVPPADPGIGQIECPPPARPKCEPH